MDTNPPPPCLPFIGPSPFTRADAAYFKGRDEETTILEGLVMSRRVVLFFAQSGAGKSSLLEAGLIPRLMEQRKIGRGERTRIYQKMSVLPVVRVGGPFPLELESSTLAVNRFVFAALSRLAPDAEPAALVGMSLKEGCLPTSTILSRRKAWPDPLIPCSSLTSLKSYSPVTPTAGQNEKICFIRLEKPLRPLSTFVSCWPSGKILLPS